MQQDATGCHRQDATDRMPQDATKSPSLPLSLSVLDMGLLLISVA